MLAPVRVSNRNAPRRVNKDGRTSGWSFSEGIIFRKAVNKAQKHDEERDFLKFTEQVLGQKRRKEGIPTGRIGNFWAALTA